MLKDDENDVYTKTWTKDEFGEEEKTVDSNNMLVLTKGESFYYIQIEIKCTNFRHKTYAIFRFFVFSIFYLVQV